MIPKQKFLNEARSYLSNCKCTWRTKDRKRWKKRESTLLFLFGRTFFGSFFFHICSPEKNFLGSIPRNGHVIESSQSLAFFLTPGTRWPLSQSLFLCPLVFWDTAWEHFLEPYRGGTATWGGVSWRHCLRLQNFFNGVEELFMTPETKLFFSPT